MRSLFATPLSPWQRPGGAQERQRVMLNALGACGHVDVVILDAPAPSIAGMRPSPGVAVHHLDRPRSPTRATVARWLTTGTAPSALLHYDAHKLRADFELLANGSQYDVFWSSTLVPLLLFGWPRADRVIVDLYDLEDEKFRQAVPTVGVALRAGSPRAVLHRALGQRDASAWASQQARVATGADAVLTCSAADRARLGVPQTVVVPNGAHDPTSRTDHTSLPSSEPTMLLHGSLGYSPNTEAARMLVREVAPRVRATIPRLRVRLVGEAPAALQELHDPPAATVTGYVPDIGTELARADLVTVPLRSGSGTRVKIIEAFAHGVPVVATSVAADGLDVRDAEHLLIRDEPAAFAAACIDLLSMAQLRKQCIANARALYCARYRWSSIEQQVRGLVAGTSGS